MITHGKINPLIGSAGVSAVPMAARVSQKVGSESDPHNFLLMHAMGPNVAGVIGSAVAAGFFMLTLAADTKKHTARRKCSHVSSSLKRDKNRKGTVLVSKEIYYGYYGKYAWRIGRRSNP